MLREMLRSMFDDARRGEDRAHAAESSRLSQRPDTGHVADRVAGNKPPILRRRTITTLCLLALAGIVYGTLAPFRIDPTRAWHWDLGLTPFQPGDAICNVLVYLPVGLLLRLMIRRRGSWAITEWLGSLALAVGLSYLTEVTQTILAGRVATLTDVALNTLGAVIGIAAAPAVQRLLRNHHAWLYGELRARPFCAMAGVAWLGLLLAALIPFDFQPTPGHLSRTIAHVRSSLKAGPWHDLRVQESSGSVNGITGSHRSPDTGAATSPHLSKMMEGGAYGVLAMLLALASVELGGSTSAAVRYGVGRTLTLAFGVEVLQGLTVSHQADPWDLLAGCTWATVGGLVAWALLSTRRGSLPRPASLLSMLLLCGATALLIRQGFATHVVHAGAHAPTAISWLPMGASFQRSWLGLMGDYASSFLRYSLICSLLTIWFRTQNRAPLFPILAAVALWFPFLGASVAILMARNYDTMQFVIALFAAGTISACDRALFGHARALTPLDHGGNHARSHHTSSVHGSR